MRHQIRNGLLQLFLSGDIGGDRIGSEDGEQVIPDGVQLVLKSVRVGSDCDHGILLGNHHAEPPGAAVAAKGPLGKSFARPQGKRPASSA